MAMFWSKKKINKEKRPVDPETVVNQSTALILPEDLQVTRELGEGQYGVVQLGLWDPKNGTNPKYVAIKSLKNTAFDGVLKDVLEEAQTMQRLSHDYIVKMYGISLPSKEEPLKLVTEYASYGSLEENLQKKDKDVCRVSALSKFAYQVAQGMDHLARQNLVHRDLSTRNILVFQPDLIKISDFGLARTLEGGAATQITLHRKLAVAWLPPEAIVKNVFTLKSDVWSYGITLWEIFSFGQQPWAELNFNQIKLMIANEPSSHLHKPDACPDGFYEIMLGCWERDSEKRPEFTDISNRVLELQPREGITRVGHHSSEQGHLSYESKNKVTVISKRESGQLLVQCENGSIGLVHEKNLDFSKKALQRRAGGRYAGDISRPFDLKKQNSTELFSKLHRGASSHTSTAANRDRAVEEDVVMKKPVRKTEENGAVHDLMDFGDDANSDPTNPLNPDRYTGNQATRENQALQQEPPDATGNHVIAQNPPEYISMGSDSPYTSMNYQPCNPAANESDYATLKEVKGPQHLMLRQVNARAPRTQSESDAVGMESDPDYAVPYQHGKGYKDDNSLGHGLQETPRGNTPRGKSPPNIPNRLDLQENAGMTSGATGSVLSSSAPSCSPFATTPRKTTKRPVPTPRRNVNPRPVSDGSLDTKPVSGRESLPANGHVPAHCNSEAVKSSGTGDVVGASTSNKVPPPIPLPYQPTKGSLKQQELAENMPVHSEMHLEEKSADDEELQVELEDQTTAPEQPLKKKHYIIIAPPIPNGEGTVQATPSQDPHGQDLSSESQTPAVDRVTGATSNRDSSQLTEDRHYVNADEVRSLSADFVDLSLEPEAEPIYDKPIQLPEPPDIPNEVLNQPPPSPSKLFGGTIRRDLDASFQMPPGGWVDNPAFHFLDQAPQPGNPPEKPVNPVDQLVHPSDQPANPGGATNGGAYGEEIDAGIREIRQICGEEVQRDWCYAALLQFQGDVSQVVRVIKVQKLFKLTGKTEQFCERTLCHCNWDLDRAAAYIFDNFQDKDV